MSVRSKTEEKHKEGTHSVAKCILRKTTVVRGQVDGKLGCLVPTMAHGPPSVEMDHTTNTKERNPTQTKRYFHDTRSAPPSIVDGRNDR